MRILELDQKKWLRLTGSQRAHLDLVVAQNDVMAIGARKALEELSETNRDTWLNRQYNGCDGLPETGQKWVRTGLLAATIVVPPNTVDPSTNNAGPSGHPQF